MGKHIWCADPQWVSEEVTRLWHEERERAIRSAGQVLAGQFAFQDHWEMERCHRIVDFGQDPAGIQWDRVPYGDEEATLACFRKTARAAKGCKLEIAQRDVYMIGGNPEKVKRYVALARIGLEG